ncbi:hypothetical protein ACP275_02G044200 [Erythranthe tilingii]
METTENSISGDDSARPWQSYNTVYTNAKAGMEGVDKEKVQRVVYEMSKGSKYFQNEERKEAYMKQKVDSMKAQLAKLTPQDLSHHQTISDKRIVELEAARDLSRIWLHVDMDAFYAAVETLSNPSLKDKPMAVGGMSMIWTANYEVNIVDRELTVKARKFGVRAAMPGFIARKLCPELIFVPTDFKKYTYYSDLTRKVYEKYDPNFLAASLDEAYLDITNYCNDKGMTSGEVAEELRESVHKETGLTCSAGVAPNRLLAKVCSDINKPNGQFVLPNERVAVVTFISSLPIRKIGGIGKVTENILNGVFGITTCEEMLQKRSFISALFSRSSADFFLSVGLGIGRTDTPEVTQRKSMSNERTFSPTEDETLIHQKLVDLSENLSSDLNKEGLCGRTLTLKLKTTCFEVRTRAVTLPNSICSSEDILKHATKLLKAELPVSLRLIGLRMSHFNEGVAVDAKQKTLSNFIVTESNIHNNTSAIDIRDPSESCNSANTPQIPDLEAETSGSFDVKDTVVNDESIMSSINTKQAMFWLNDYECSVCGTELPPSFVEERQEHFDFHLAQSLQDEEKSSNRNPILKPKQRLIEKDEMRQSGPRKKQKASPSEGKHIPIHMFFAKTSQNF